MKRWNCPTCGGLVRKEIHPDGLTAARACRMEGFCMFCEKPLPKTKFKRRVICGSKACSTAYQSAVHRDLRFKRAAR